MSDQQQTPQTSRQILKQLPLFFGLQSFEYDVLLDICKVRPLESGEILFREGQTSRSFFTLLHGEIHLLTETRGTLHVVRPGEIFGEIGVIGEIPRTASAVVMQAGHALEIQGGEFKMLLSKAPRVSSIILRNITINLASHITRMNNTLSAEYIPPLHDVFSTMHTGQE